MVKLFFCFGSLNRISKKELFWHQKLVHTILHTVCLLIFFSTKELIFFFQSLLDDRIRQLLLFFFFKLPIVIRNFYWKKKKNLRRLIFTSCNAYKSIVKYLNLSVGKSVTYQTSQFPLSVIIIKISFGALDAVLQLPLAMHFSLSFFFLRTNRYNNVSKCCVPVLAHK